MDNTLKEKIGKDAYKVTQEHATEMPFSGKYVNETRQGTYKCVVCDSNLFSSKTKFNSNTGWPSFYDVIKSDNISLKTDMSLNMSRTEVSCKKCHAHLGHLFKEENNTPTGNRYCINSCSLNLELKKDV